MIQISERVYITPCDPIKDRPALGYVKGSKYSVCLDAGSSPAHHKEFLEAVKAEGLDAPKLCLITHWHWDHTYAMCALECPSIAGEATDFKIRQMMDWKWDEESIKRRVQTGEDVQFCVDHLPLEYPDFKGIEVVPADITFRGTLNLDLGDIRLQAINLVSPHTEDCVVFLADDVLFMGDSLSPKILGEDWVVFPNLQRQLIRQLSTISFQTAVWGHGDPLTKEQLIAQLEEGIASVQ